MTFKTTEAQHLHETVYFPAKPDWKPINLTLFDLVRNENPIIKWINELYEVTPTEVYYKTSTVGFKKDAKLELYDGCGEIIETWVFENIGIENAEFGELDHSEAGIVFIDLTLRYDRAYLQVGDSDTVISNPNDPNDDPPPPE